MSEQAGGPRVLVALDALAHATAAIATASALAAELDAELAGLFIEDIGLQHLLALPFARELCVLSGALRPLSQAEVERTWRHEAAALRRQLAETAAARTLRWSFQVTRGRIGAEVHTRGSAFDLVVVAERRGIPESPPRAASGPVLVLSEADETPGDVLNMATRLAARSRTQLVIMHPAVETCAPPSARLLAQDPVARCLALPNLEVTSVARAVRHERAGCLVLGRHSRIARCEALEHILDAVACPVILSG